MPRYAIGYLVSTGSPNAVGNKAAEIAGMLVGRDPLPEDPTYFTRYVLNGVTVSVTDKLGTRDEEVEIICYCALETNVSAQVRARIEANNPIPGPACNITYFAVQSMTDAQMQERLREHMRNDSRLRVWWITPATTIPAQPSARLAQFAEGL